MSGLVASVTLQPFDVVKTRMQACAFSGAPKSMLKATKAVVAIEGTRALWAGVGPACIRLGAGAGFYFFVLERLRIALDSRTKGQPGVLAGALQTVGSGVIARSLAAAVFCPISVVKTRMEYSGVSGIKYANTAAALVSIARQERLRGLFSGLVPTIVRDAPFSGLYLLLYTRLKAAANEVPVLQDSMSPFVINFMSGALAGAAATLLTHPPDVIRTRLQLQYHATLPGAIAAGKKVEVSLMGIARNEGFKALWVGVGPRVLRRTLQTAITWSLYEELVSILDHSRKQTVSQN
eukprot:CAMPEP_0196590768 /NCGR_PEP_ID=MMETSP1081-20130531/67483_1 /TAXON_ID=36882 /ORGANISM="Pyramimonas amylifera, Strain CCMP720" /LENGTH=292 /DNA_ID=CAMNT_0041913961 /DNA_START=326 /DNA_END=1204 /DNA_ORIENTATION=-